ncbi:hypothetical protein GQ457_12G017520 [Hibiscus cannabinus]
MATIIRSYEANTRMMKQNSEMLQEILRQVKLLAAHLGIMDEGEIRGDGKVGTEQDETRMQVPEVFDKMSTPFDMKIVDQPVHDSNIDDFHNGKATIHDHFDMMVPLLPAPSNPMLNYMKHEEQNITNQTPPLRISVVEPQKHRENRFCYECDEKYNVGRRCKGLQLRSLYDFIEEVTADELDEKSNHQVLAQKLQELKGLSVVGKTNHGIQFDPGGKSKNVKPCQSLCDQNEVIEHHMKKKLDERFVHCSRSLYFISLLLKNKKDDKRQSCVDDRGLDVATIKDGFSIPNIIELFDDLTGAKIFFKLDMLADCRQIRVKLEEMRKTIFWSSIEQYESLVIAFRLITATSIYQAPMNGVFQPFSRNFMLILGCSKARDDHVEVKQLSLVLQLVMGNEFVPTKSKCAAGNDSSDYLRDVVIHQGLRLVSTKVDVIQLWPTPTSLKEVWQELSRLHRTKFGMNSIYSLQVDNQIEALRRCWKMYLQCFTSMKSFKALYGRDSLALIRYELPSTKDNEVGRALKNHNEILWKWKTNLGIVSLHLVVLVGIIVEYKNQYQHVAEAKYGCHVLIIDSITGGFEAGISKVGQTRKHVLLAFSIGVKQMIYCCNKMDATILNYSKASFEALYSDNIRKNVAVEDLKRGIIALNSKDDTVKEATNFTSQVIVISEELKMNLEDKVLSLEEGNVMNRKVWDHFVI